MCRNCFLKYIIKCGIEGSIKVTGRGGRSSYWIRYDNGKLMRQHYMALYGEVSPKSYGHDVRATT